MNRWVECLGENSYNYECLSIYFPLSVGVGALRTDSMTGVSEAGAKKSLYGAFKAYVNYFPPAQ